jgi:beta-phosphoglucomutase
MFKINKVFILATIFLCFNSSYAVPNPENKIEAIIFDCDGVLIDTEGLKLAAWQDALIKHGVDFKKSEYITLVGYSSEHIFDHLKKPDSLNQAQQQVISKMKQNYKTLQLTAQPIQPAVALLQKLAQNKKKYKFKLGLASSAHKQEILVNLDRLKITDFFDAIVSGNDDLKEIHDPEGTNKPKPYIYQKIAVLLGVKPENCIVFEDSGAGVVAAATAGMQVYAVPNEFTKHHDFSMAKARLESLAEFENLQFLSNTQQ